MDGTCAWSSDKATAVKVAGHTDVANNDKALAEAVAEGPVSVAVAAND